MELLDRVKTMANIMETNPRIGSSKLFAFCEEILAESCSGDFEDGLNYFGLANPNFTGIRPTPPIKPDDAVGNSSLERAQNDKSELVYQRYVSKMAEVTATLREAVGETIREELKGGDTPYRNIKFHEIINHVHKNYGTMSSNDIESLLTQVATPFTSPELYVAEAASKRKILKILSDAGAPMNDHDQVQMLIKSSNDCCPIKQHCNHFCKDTPLRADRTFHKMVTYITLHLQASDNKETNHMMSANMATQESSGPP